MKTKWKNSPLAFPNNSTIFAPNLILSYFSTPCPLSSRLGAFLFPRNIFSQIFSEIFSQSDKATFCCIFGAKNYGGKGRFSLPKWGGCPLLYALYISNRHSLTQGISRHLHHSTRTKRHRNRAKRGKSKHLFDCFCLPLVILETTNGKNLIYFWNVGKVNGWKCCLFAYVHGVHWVQRCRTFRGFRTCRKWLWSSGRVLLPFCPLSRFICGAL